jgi:hypothetical protein
MVDAPDFAVMEPVRIVDIAHDNPTLMSAPQTRVYNVVSPTRYTLYY